MTAINLALRNPYGYVIHGNSLTDQRRLVYRTGFNLSGFIRELLLTDCPENVQNAMSQTETNAVRKQEGAAASAPDDRPAEPKQQLFLF